ncbi:hypothetical protein WMY93_031993 [Mugilogobius chulae]|uniref:DDE Tnp4 domain-containing protein n=1 Tax=Mugilogobius chulae TaxID=88201 RepID=A0AAW0MKK0_9GOBI
MSDTNVPPPSRKRKSVYEVAERRRQDEKDRNQTKVIIGGLFQRWRALKQTKGLKTDAMVAKLLLDSYYNVTSTPLPHTSWTRPPQPPVSTIAKESLLDSSSSSTEEQPFAAQEQHRQSTSRDEEVENINEEDFNSLHNTTVEWDDETWTPEMQTQIESSSEEYETKEYDTYSDDGEDQDYIPPLCLRAGGALKTQFRLENLPQTHVDETVHDDPNDCEVLHDTTPLDTAMAFTEEDQLLDYLHLPIDKCPAKDPVTKEPCNESRPFEVTLKRRCTAVIAEWICPNGHTVWKWSSQRYFKYGMLVGDFMLGVNVLLSGNNFRKVALFFKFMNIGMIDPTTFHKIQDGFCVDNIASFWKSDTEGIINDLKSKEPVVLLGDGRMDSPGHCAEYSTYTMMDNDTKKIVYMYSSDKQKGIYKDSGIKHSLDIWHGAKNLNFLCLQAGRTKECSLLLRWARDITNHFWYCCKTAETYEEFMVCCVLQSLAERFCLQAVCTNIVKGGMDDFAGFQTPRTVSPFLKNAHAQDQPPPSLHLRPQSLVCAHAEAEPVST